MKTLKKALILGLSLLLVISAIPTVVFAETADIAAQTTTDGWTSISTPEQFLAIDDTDAGKTGNYYLTNDIDFGGETYESLINGFEGIIEGNGYALENFKLSVTSDSEDDVNVGVIGLAGKGYNTIIRNLRIEFSDQLFIDTSLATSVRYTTKSGNNCRYDSFLILHVRRSRSDHTVSIKTRLGKDSRDVSGI